jgi:hypothetical protein
MVRTPLVARSISNLLKSKKIRTLGKTHNVIACVIIFASAILSRYVTSPLPREVKAKVIRPTISGSRMPDTIPETRLSYFSVNFIS